MKCQTTHSLHINSQVVQVTENLRKNVQMIQSCILKIVFLHVPVSKNMPGHTYYTSLIKEGECPFNSKVNLYAYIMMCKIVTSCPDLSDCPQFSLYIRKYLGMCLSITLRF